MYVHVYLLTSIIMPTIFHHSVMGEMRQLVMLKKKQTNKLNYSTKGKKEKKKEQIYNESQLKMCPPKATLDTSNLLHVHIYILITGDLYTLSPITTLSHITS